MGTPDVARAALVVAMASVARDAAYDGASPESEDFSAERHAGDASGASGGISEGDAWDSGIRWGVVKRLRRLLWVRFPPVPPFLIRGVGQRLAA